MDTSHPYDPTNIRNCARCGIRYDWRRSASSSLKMTYCGSLCEAADLGFTIEALIRTERGEAPSSQATVKALLTAAA
ncbi:MAG: hypothetical protein LC118_01935 [Dehalococcoidia bacterium]|nr:hypothetical protein [Dehalococcoidia bacterium]